MIIRYDNSKMTVVEIFDMYEWCKTTFGDKMNTTLFYASGETFANLGAQSLDECDTIEIESPELALLFKLRWPTCN